MKKTNANPVENFDQKLNKGLAGFWFVLMCGSLAGVIIKGAYWHLFTAAICCIMWLAMRSGDDE